MKKLFAGLAVLPVLFFCSPASAAENNTLPDNQTAVVKEYTTTNPNFAEQFDSEFETVVEQDGQKYNLLRVTYSVTGEEPLERPEPITHKVTYPDLYTPVSYTHLCQHFSG